MIIMIIMIIALTSSVSLKNDDVISYGTFDNVIKNFKVTISKLFLEMTVKKNC